MQLEIKVDLGRLATLDSRLTKSVDRALHLGTTDATTLLLREMRNYPPPPPPIDYEAKGYNKSKRGKNRFVVHFVTGAGVGVAFDAHMRRYKRTYTLRRSWTKSVKRTAAGWEGNVTSSGDIAPYNVYVQKEGIQAAVHEGRWGTEVSITNRLRPEITRMYEVRVAQAVSRA